MRNSIPSLFEMTRQLIASPSMSSVNPDYDTDNRAVIDLLAGWLETLGFAVEVMALPNWPGKANLIATLGSGPGGLVLAGHTDTVPFDAGRWSHDPFQLTEADGRWYGLGTADMKAFLALAVEAAREVRADQLQAPLILLATADEESSMDGAKELVHQGRPAARFAVVGEPTGLKPVRMHKGILMESIRLLGRSGHSSDPSLGASALEGMYEVMSELMAWRTELQRDHRQSMFSVPVPTMNFGHIHGGDNPNRICAQCELHIDLRPLPGMELEDLRAQMRNRLGPHAEQRGLKLEIEPLFEGIPAFENPADSLLVRTAERLTGHSAGAVAFGTEAPYFARLGMETIVLGPGDIAQAHQPDEYLALDRLRPTVELLRSLIDRFCCQPASA